MMVLVLLGRCSTSHQILTTCLLGRCNLTTRARKLSWKGWCFLLEKACNQCLTSLGWDRLVMNYKDLRGFSECLAFFTSSLSTFNSCLSNELYSNNVKNTIYWQFQKRPEDSEHKVWKLEVKYSWIWSHSGQNNGHFHKCLHEKFTKMKSTSQCLH